MDGKTRFKFFKPIHFSHCTKDDIKNYFNGTFELYEGLFSSITKNESYYLCPDRLRLPLVFYYGHTAAVFINKLCLAGLIKPKERVNIEFETIFETGVDEMSWDTIEHYRMGGEMKWPTIEEITDYRAECKALINDVIDRNELVLPITMDSPWWSLLLGIEHENIHFETSSVLIRQYPIEMVNKPDGWMYSLTIQDDSRKINLKNKMIPVTDKESLKVKIGKRHDFPNYGWDNEYGLLECELTPFEASEFKITNEQFLEFVLKGGYETEKYWSAEGWKWRNFKNTKHPKFWVCPKNCPSTCGGPLSACSHCTENNFTETEVQKFDDNFKIIINKDWNETFIIEDFGYKYRLMFDIVPMPSNWPVEVNYHEAKAYCNWKGKDFRLLSEAEHHALRDPINESIFESDINFQDGSKFNNRLNYGSSTVVDMYKPTRKGFYDVFGNVWEWTEDHFNGLPMGTLDNLYADFSTPCYDGRHNLIMGGSWASCGNIASYFARFMFRRHFFQHCGFRVARSLPTEDGSKFNPQIRYVADSISVLGETEKTVNKSDLDQSKYEINYYSTTNTEYFYDSDLRTEVFEKELVFEFNSEWVQKMAENIEKVLNGNKVNRMTAVHFGTSSGRLSMELAKTFEQVYGLDFSTKLLDIALKLQNQKEINIKLDNQEISYNIKDNIHASKVNFKQLTWIPNEVPQSELVLFTMLDRLGNHQSWLRRLKELVNPEGVLILYSQETKYDSQYLAGVVHEFQLVDEVSILPNDSLTVWKLKKDYFESSL